MKMKIQIFYIVLTIFSLCTTIYSNEIISAATDAQADARSFQIDYENDQFLLDGKPFRFISGSFHYFRALPETWQKKLRTMRAAGLNAVTTYVEWSLHNPQDGVYNWEGIADLVKFISLAVKEDLYVIFRPGPYICAERDMGGFPYWLLNKYPGIKLRTVDANYLKEVRLWYSKLMPLIEPFLYGNGGPIIMVQVENEYGSFYACDNQYLLWLKNETENYVDDKAVLFTNDGPDQLRCGKIEGVFATLDFGASLSIDTYWKKLRDYQPKGPLVNSEYYPGWLTHWQEKMQRPAVKPMIDSFIKMLNQNASINFYMFFGGTNFGFTAGANDGGPGSFNADVTSYDYDAPMDEAGDPTNKFALIRDVIEKYLPLPNISIPDKEPKMNLGPVLLNPIDQLLSESARHHLASNALIKRKPITFEEYNQYSGFILYETSLPRLKRDPSILKIDILRDRASIFVDKHYVGIMSRENKIYELPITAGTGDTLRILVENQGRINYNIANDFKGIIGDVRLNGSPMYNWTITGFPLDNYSNIQNLINEKQRKSLSERIMLMNSEPTIFHGSFELKTPIYDTYLDPTGWGKGVAFVNGFNLGRYWPSIGPQITLYVPKDILQEGANTITLLELQKAPQNTTVIFTDIPNLDGYN